MLPLNDPTLLVQAAYINGQWCHAEDDDIYTIINPANSTSLGNIPMLGVKETKNAILAAHHALPEWRKKTAKERHRILHKWYELIIENEYDLALILTSEQGKPLTEALQEIQYAASFIEWFAEQGKRVSGQVLSPVKPDQRLLITKEPVGVCAAITPWNFPCAMITRKVAPALAAGCTIIVKPDHITPFSALALAVLAHRAGIPPGVLNIITGPAEKIGAELCANPLVRKLSFTGSTRVGRILMQQCASNIKKLSLELGGNAPFIVFEDANITHAVTGAIHAKFRNAGQTCISPNRFYIHDAVYEHFVKQFITATQKFKIGNGRNQGIQMGPLISSNAIQRIESYIQDAINKGAQLLLGGKRHSLQHSFFEPTVLGEVKDNMLISQEEIFGPIAAFSRFSETKDVIFQANNSQAGLAAYFYTAHLSRIWEVSEALEYGMIGINNSQLSNEVTPFGGMKQSGIGREGSEQGIEEYLEVKYLSMG